MPTSAPEISVLISTYNDRDWIDKKLCEIRAQTAFERAEFIFIEPASPGRERELLEPFCEQHANCQLITFEQRLSLYRAWNVGWEAATAPLVCISNMDDTMHPRLLERVLVEMPKAQCDLFSVLIAKQSVDADLNSFKISRLKQLDISLRPGPFFVWKRDLLPSFGPFDDRLEVIGDKDFWARAHHLKLKIGLLPEVLYLYTKHPDQLSKSTAFLARRQADTALSAQKEYPHRWSPTLQRQISRIRKMRRIPLIGEKLSHSIYINDSFVNS
ncbi:MAG: glycosyltransferase [Opitutae bacterium]|nr:glycosyltransferase [Opitutae bacterium]